MKRMFALLLALLLLLGCCPAAFAEEGAPVTLASAADFLRFAAACELESYSAGRVFELTADLDLSNTGFAPVPYFAGSFHGNGHLITGLKIEGGGLPPRPLPPRRPRGGDPRPHGARRGHARRHRDAYRRHRRGERGRAHELRL